MRSAARRCVAAQVEDLVTEQKSRGNIIMRLGFNKGYDSGAAAAQAACHASEPSGHRPPVCVRNWLPLLIGETDCRNRLQN